MDESSVGWIEKMRGLMPGRTQSRVKIAGKKGGVWDAFLMQF